MKRRRVGTSLRLVPLLLLAALLAACGAAREQAAAPAGEAEQSSKVHLTVYRSPT